MLRLCVKAENKKLRHSVIWAACILIPIIPAIMGTFNYQQNLGILTGKWYSLWSQLSLFYASFFYAPLIALYCSYLWRLEHLNHNWNVLMTAPVSIPNIFFSKLAVIFKVTLITQIWLAVLFLLCGKTYRASRVGSLPDPRLDPARNSGGYGDRRSAAAAFHVYPKLLGPHRDCLGRRRGRTCDQQQGAWSVLAVCPDAHGNELQ